MKKKKNALDLEFVQNAPKYVEFIRRLRNMPTVREKFISQEYIGRKQQAAYMTKHRNHYYLCLCNGRPVGYVGVIRGDIRVAVLPKFQKRKIGIFLIKNIMEKYPTLQAKIKVDNVASFRLFKKAGFTMKYFIFEYRKEDIKDVLKTTN